MSERSRMTRREFLVSSAALAAGTVLAACQPAATPAPPKATEPPMATEPPEAATEIAVLAWSSDVFEDFFNRYEEDSGVHIKFETFPPSWEEMLSKFTMWGETGYDGIDVMAQDDMITALWAKQGWAEDVAYLLSPEELEDQVDPLDEFHDFMGGQHRIYYSLDAIPFYFNKDIVSEAPKDWDELIQIGKEVTNPAEDLWGFRPESGMNYPIMMINHAGGDPYKLDDEGTLTALKFMRDLVFEHKITPETTVSEQTRENYATAAAGQTAMWQGYGNGYGDTMAIEGSVLTTENSGIARWPMGPASDNGMLHAWGWILPKYTKKKEQAEHFIQWMNEFERLKELDIAFNLLPCRKSLLEDKEYTDALAILTAGPGWTEIIRGAKFRCPTACETEMAGYSLLFNDLFQHLMSGEKTPEEAQQWAVEELARVTG